ncbi:hypothetical protein [Amycolatopsis sp. NPDC004079]|uniref:hypothetical protein n=1 Tax=Amycolatopsis sp. NPDC004079 TaxID=3154549 RepID=UPI0033AC243F
MTDGFLIDPDTRLPLRPRCGAFAPTAEPIGAGPATPFGLTRRVAAVPRDAVFVTAADGRLVMASPQGTPFTTNGGGRYFDSGEDL